MIILDANVLPRHGSLAGPAFALVRAIAEKTGHDVALPAIVVEESVAKFTRELRKAWDRTKTAEQALAEFFPGYRIDQPDLSKRVEQWRKDLKRSFAILDTPPGAAEEALRREAHRIAPTRSAGPKGSGIGARDALIWLTVLDAYGREPVNGVAYFVTNNPDDFGRGALLPALQREVDAIATTTSFHYLTSMTGLLDALATPVSDGPTESELFASHELRAAVEQALRSMDVVGGDGGEWLPTFRPGITGVSLRKAETNKAYEVGGQRFAAVSTVWNGVSSTISGSTGTSVSYEHLSHYVAELLLIVEFGDDGRVTSAEVTSAGPFVYDRSETRIIE